MNGDIIDIIVMTICSSVFITFIALIFAALITIVVEDEQAN